MTNEIKQIEKVLDECNQAYHVFGTSQLSDAEYDSLKDRLSKLDPTNPRLKQVGAKLVPEIKKKKEKIAWEKYIHKTERLGSLNKINTFAELETWIKGSGETDFIIEEKLDGISIKLIYNNGELYKAITRGDDASGESVGEDITRNVIKMKNVPLDVKIKDRFIVRGEILLHKDDFEFVGGKTLRNSAAGTAKRLDGVGCEYLSVHAYTIMNWKELNIKTESEMIKILKDNNFNVISNKLCKSVKTIESEYQNYISNIRDSLQWDIDGLVIKTNIIKDDDWDYPKRAIAYKFPHQEAITKLLSVEWQDSGGRITPVGHLEPVNVNGVTISKATLNNVDYIKNLNIKINDLCAISRRNDVIPCIERVSIAASDGIEIKAPTHDEEGFPIVHEKNSQGEELVYLTSTNPNSKQKKIRSIIQWYKAHDTKGVAEETIDAILSEKIANSLPEFFDIGLKGHQNLANVEGFGPGKFKILNKATLLTSKTTLIKFMEGIDISGFGSSRFETILEAVNKEVSITDFVNICSDSTFISQLIGFGENTAATLKNSLESKKNLIKEMLNRVEVENWKPQTVSSSSKINGLSFCFTGKMQYDRGTLELSVKKQGGLVAGVSKNLDYLVVNDLNSNSSKNKKAIKLNIKRISEKEYLNMIEGKI
jgi:DNA ligase (NAD+)